MTDELADAALRRRPRQDRSTQRIEDILDTTGALIDELGYANISPTLIAKRIGMSSAGIYRYFDGMEAVASALAKRNLARFIERTSAILADPESTWEVLTAKVIDVYCDMHREEPGFAWLRLGDTSDRRLIAGTVSNRTVIARMVSELFVRRFEVDPRPNQVRHVEVVIEIVDSLTARAFESDPHGDLFFINECIEVTTEYVRNFLGRVQPVGVYDATTHAASD